MQTPCKRAASNGILDRGSTAKRPRTSHGSVSSKFYNNVTAWTAALPLAPCSSKSWMTLESDAVRCLACPGFVLRSPVTLQLCNLRRHHDSTSHRQSVARFLVTSTDADVLAAPEKEEFESVLRHSLDMGTVRAVKTESTVGTWHKRRRMEWCMAEGKRSLDREFMRTATVASLLQDARQGTLLLRLVAADARLNTRSVILGLRQFYGSTAADICKTVQAVITEFCTANVRLPPRRAGAQPPTPTLDRELCAHLCSIIELFAADGASDEQVAGRDLQAPLDGMPAPLPNLRVLIRDKAHSTRHLLKRPWTADHVLRDTVEKLIFQKRTVVRLIQFSHIFKSWFMANQQSVAATNVHDGQDGQGGRVVRDFSWAPQRFDSRSKPLIRFCLKFDAVVLTAMQIATKRAGKSEGQVAAEFLGHISVERMILLGMMADASDEGLRFTRFCDTETMDVSQITHEVGSFLNRITTLFVDGRCLQTGFTKLMLQLVKKVRIVWVNHAPRVVGVSGGAPQDLVGKCLARMACWVRLCIHILEAEFPHHELVQCFSVFNVASRTDATEGPDVTSEKLARLAHVIKVDPVALVNEYKDHLPTAERRAVLDKCDNLQAWKAALRDTQSRASVAANHPVRSLHPVLMRFAAYRASTSGVEQSFSHLQWLQSQKRSCSSEQAELDAMTLRLDLPKDEHASVIQRARQLWAQHYGAPRHGGVRCLVHRCSRSGSVGPDSQDSPQTEAALIRQRRRETSQLASTSCITLGTALAAAVRVGASVWDERHSKEAQLQQLRAKQRRVDSAALGLLLPTEVDAETRADMQAACQRRQANHDTRRRRQEAVKKVELGVKVVMTNLQVHFAPSLGDSPQWSIALGQHHARRCLDPARAQMWVVPNPCEVGILTRVAAALRGGVVATPEFFTTGGRSGACLAYHAAVPRRVWASNRFRHRHPGVITIIETVQTVKTDRAGKWQWIRTCSDFVARCRNKAPRHQLQAGIGLITLEDRAVAGGVPSYLF